MTPIIEKILELKSQNKQTAFWIRRDSSNKKLWYIASRSYVKNTDWEFYIDITKSEAKYLHENEILSVWHVFTTKDGHVNW